MSSIGSYFFVPDFYRPNSAEKKPYWVDYELAGVRRSNKPNDPIEYWLHIHGSTPSEVHASAQIYLDEQDLGKVFRIAESSILSTDPDDDDLGIFLRLDVLDPERAREFDPEQDDPVGTGHGWGLLKW